MTIISNDDETPMTMDFAAESLARFFSRACTARVGTSRCNLLAVLAVCGGARIRLGSKSADYF